MPIIEGKFTPTFRCPFCTGEQCHVEGIHKDSVREHLIVTKDENNRFHVHGPVHNKVLMKEFLLVIAKESEIELEE